MYSIPQKPEHVAEIKAVTPSGSVSTSKYRFGPKYCNTLKCFDLSKALFQPELSSSSGCCSGGWFWQLLWVFCQNYHILYFAQSNFPSTPNIFQIPVIEKTPYSMMMPPPFFCWFFICWVFMQCWCIHNYINSWFLFSGTLAERFLSWFLFWSKQMTLFHMVVSFTKLVLGCSFLELSFKNYFLFCWWCQQIHSPELQVSATFLESLHGCLLCLSERHLSCFSDKFLFVHSFSSDGIRLVSWIQMQYFFLKLKPWIFCFQHFMCVLLCFDVFDKTQVNASVTWQTEKKLHSI